jgi:tetratricopeptide (TPR) repeat protein
MHARRASLAAVLAACALTILPAAADAQGRVPPLGLITAAPASATSCANVSPRPAVANPDTVAARRLATEGSDAALLGDVATARARLEEAVRSAPMMEDLEYQLGRLYEEQGDASAAAQSYCRYLALASTASDSTEARRRLEGLSGQTEEAASVVTVQLRTGAAYARRGEFMNAAGAFQAATNQSPNLAEGYHDQAAALVAAGRLDEGRELLERYVRLRPSAPDGQDVRRQIRLLERTRYSPAAALGSGLIPGGGQFYTRRYVMGALVAAAAAGGVVVALEEESEIRTVTGVDDNGIPYQYEARFTERPNLVMGLGITAGAALLGAIEAWWWSDRGQNAAKQLSRDTAAELRGGGSAGNESAVRIAPDRRGLALRVFW